MSAAARGAAGARYLRERARRKPELPPDAQFQAEQHIAKFIRDPGRVRELAAAAVQLAKKPVQIVYRATRRRKGL